MQTLASDEGQILNARQLRNQAQNRWAQTDAAR